MPRIARGSLEMAIKLTSALMLITPSSASAGPLLDYIRDYDLNDYALGLSIATSQSPYLGADNSVAAYPILTSFRHSSLTDDWLLIQGENIGFRYVTDNDWELGLIGRIQPLGGGMNRSDDLLGLDERLSGSRPVSLLLGSTESTQRHYERT